MNRIGIGLIVFCAILAACGNEGNSTKRKKRADRDDRPHTTTATSEERAPPADVAGGYTITGTNQNGSPYHGTLDVKAQGDVFQFHWVTGPAEYDGVGVALDQTIGVAFAVGRDGKGCGVAHYKSTLTGLSGRWGEWGVNRSGTETATRRSGPGLAGGYDVTGTMPNGTTYRGALKVAAEGAGFSFDWDGSEAGQGFGIQLGDYVSVGIGTESCGFISYEVGPDGRLAGRWSTFKARAVGTEIAKKRPGKQ
jgi:hypothetical protein